MDQVANRLKQVPALLALLLAALIAAPASAGAGPQPLARSPALAQPGLAFADGLAGLLRDRASAPAFADDRAGDPDPDDASLPAAHRPGAAPRLGHACQRAAPASRRSGSASAYRARAPPAA